MTKQIKFVKTKLDKLPHPIGKRPAKYFAADCEGLAIFVQPQPSLKKTYMAHWSTVSYDSNGK